MSLRRTTFLIDTGATISIFKINKLNANYQIDQSSTCKITGIKEGFVESLGYTTTELIMDNLAIKHDFHIVDKDFPIPADGILGLDFITKFKCNLNYDKWKLTMNPSGVPYSVQIPMYDSPYTSNSNFKTVLALPARSEVIRRVHIQNKDENVIIPNQEIADGIFVGRAIVNKNNPYVKILNTQSENKTLYNIEITTEKLTDYNLIDPSDYKSSHSNLIMKKLEKNFPNFARKCLKQLCSKFLDIFALETDKITVNNFYKQKLHLKDSNPVYIKNYRIPNSHKDIINKKVDIMLENNTIQPSMSEYNSPVLLVPKKSLPGSSEKRWRFCVDYRQINKKLVADRFPLPRMDDILDQLGRARFFSVIDLLNGFFQIGLDEDSKDITSFSTDKGSYKFNSIPFGLKIGPNSFQRMMSIAFSGLSPSQCFIYMDDLVVIAVSEKQMVENLTQVFTICRKFNLKLNPDKCEFFRKEVTYLGHKCTEHGILPDESKYSKIENYPRPKNPDEVKRFVAFSNYYRRFIPHFAHHAYHLTRLTRKKIKFHWSLECEDAFLYLKNSLKNPPILKYPDFSKPFCITTDASKIACGAILSQNYNGLELPVSYASRSFTKGEQNKSTPLQELTAIHWALNFFRPYIYGTRFLVKSDHRSLIYLFTMKNPNSKLIRMRLDLEEYDFEIEYIKGKNNVGADALSRIDFDDIKKLSAEVDTIVRITTRSGSRKFNQVEDQNLNHNYKDVKINKVKIYEVNSPLEVRKLPRIIFKIYANNPYCTIKKGKQTIRRFCLWNYIKNDVLSIKEVLSRLEQEEIILAIGKLQLSINDSIFNLISVQKFKEIAGQTLRHLIIALTPKTTYITDDNEKQNLINKYHNDKILGGHSGTRRLYCKLRLKYFWPGMTKDVSTFVKQCKECQLNKARVKNRENLSITPTPQYAFDIVLVDTIGPLIKSDKGNAYAVTLICDLTKYLVTVPIPDNKATTVAKAIFENFILCYGPMQHLLTDRGSEYINSILQELCKLLNITQSKSTAYHHRTLGTIERSHRTFNEYVRSYVNESKTDWDDWLGYFTYCYNTTPSTAIQNYCPFQLIFGKIPSNYEFLNSKYLEPIYNLDSYYREVKYRLHSASLRAQKYLENSKLKRYMKDLIKL